MFAPTFDRNKFSDFSAVRCRWWRQPLKSNTQCNGYTPCAACTKVPSFSTEVAQPMAVHSCSTTDVHPQRNVSPKFCSLTPMHVHTPLIKAEYRRWSFLNLHPSFWSELRRVGTG